MKNIFILLITIISTNIIAQKAEFAALLNQDNAEDRIQVLNFGTFHMSYTPDANTTEFDEHDKKNQADVHAIAAELAAFKPTVILVETTPDYDQELQSTYLKYIESPDMKFDAPSEIELLAYELGRVAGVDRIHGIDHKMNYNYSIAQTIDNKIDAETCNAFFSNPTSTFPFLAIPEERLTLKEKLIGANSERYLDFLITINADILTHAGTEDNFEGADEAAKYYQRNLRMFANMNRLDLKKDDRVFILMGASHTAFFRDFMSRSPKYHMVNTMDYLKWE